MVTFWMLLGKYYDIYIHIYIYRYTYTHTHTYIYMKISCFEIKQKKINHSQRDTIIKLLEV